MDKNMINIDDLFKQRMTGAEEKERPGAWLQMRELLDREMPVTAPGAATNWRRMFGYAAGLILLASATVGGYQAYTSFRNEPSKDIVAVNYNNLEASNNTGNNVSGQAQNIPNQPKEGGASSVASNDANENPSGKSATNTGNDNVSGRKTDNTAKTVTNSNNIAKSTSEAGRSSETVSNSNNRTEKQSTAGKSVKTVTNSNNNAVASNNTLNRNTEKDQPKTTTIDNRSNAQLGDNSLKDNKINNAVASIAAGNAAAKPGSAPERNFAAGSNTAVNTGNSKGSAPNKPSGNNNTAGNKAAQPAKPAEVAKNDYTAKQMIDKIETKETYDRKSGTWKQDTIDQGKVEWGTKDESLLAMKGGEARTKNNVEILPSANIEVNGTALNEAEELLPLSNFRTARKNTNYTTSNFLEEMVKNAKMQLGGAKFYPGVLLGVNTALSGKNSMYGFQAGVTGTLSLNEKWAIVSELKYMHRFKSAGESNRNDYISKTTQSTDQNGNTIYVSDSVKHYFTYPSVSTFELPVMLRYSVKRINVLAGANFAYNLGFSPNELSETYTKVSTTIPKPAEGAIMTASDFKSRFGIGYQFGLGYQISPAIGLDARFSQSLWNSGSGAGMERVSREVYQTPTLLINFNYRFSSNKYKPYRQQ